MAIAAVLVCANCQRDLARIASIICADCDAAKAPSLCLNCFSSGAEPGNHKAYHRYCVRDNRDAMRIFREDWSAREELALLDGIKRHGLGNWRDVATVVGSKSERRCEEHYLDEYVGIHGRWLPQHTLEHTLPKPTSTSQAASASNTTKGNADSDSSSATFAESSSSEAAASKAASATAASDAPPAYVLTEELLPLDQRLEATEAAYRAEAEAASAQAASGEPNLPLGRHVDPAPGTPCEREAFRDKPRATVQQVQERIAQLPGAALGGFMPLRNDFDVEHANDAEQVLAELEFFKDDSVADKALKLDVCKIYNAKLDERERRKRFVVERGLVDYTARAAEDKKRPRDERDLVARMRVFARFQTVAEHEAFVDGLLEAKRLRKRIDELQHWRRVGIRTLGEGKLYEQERDRQAAMSAAQPLPSSAAGAAEALNPTSTTAAGGAKDVTSGKHASSGASAGPRLSALSPPPANCGQEAAAAVAAATGLTEDVAWLQQQPGYELLSSEERKLCSQLRLRPDHYQLAKDALVRESLRCGLVSHDAAHQLVRLDITPVLPHSAHDQATGQVYDFLLNSGWISVAASNAPPPPPPPRAPGSRDTEGGGRDAATSAPPPLGPGSSATPAAMATATNGRLNSGAAGAPSSEVAS